MSNLSKSISIRDQKFIAISEVSNLLILKILQISIYFYMQSYRKINGPTQPWPQGSEYRYQPRRRTRWRLRRLRGCRWRRRRRNSRRLVRGRLIWVWQSNWGRLRWVIWIGRTWGRVWRWRRRNGRGIWWRLRLGRGIRWKRIWRGLQLNRLGRWQRFSSKEQWPQQKWKTKRPERSEGSERIQRSERRW